MTFSGQLGKGLLGSFELAFVGQTTTVETLAWYSPYKLTPSTPAIGTQSQNISSAILSSVILPITNEWAGVQQNKIYLAPIDIQQVNLWRSHYSPQQLSREIDWYGAKKNVVFASKIDGQQVNLFSPIFSPNPTPTFKTVEWKIRTNTTYAPRIDLPQINLWNPAYSPQQGGIVVNNIEWLTRSGIPFASAAPPVNRAAWLPQVSYINSDTGWMLTLRPAASVPAVIQQANKWHPAFSPQQLQRTIEWLPRTKTTSVDQAAIINASKWIPSLTGQQAPIDISWLRKTIPAPAQDQIVVNTAKWQPSFTRGLVSVEWIGRKPQLVIEAEPVRNPTRWQSYISPQQGAQGIDWMRGKGGTPENVGSVANDVVFNPSLYPLISTLGVEWLMTVHKNYQEPPIISNVAFWSPLLTVENLYATPCRRTFHAHSIGKVFEASSNRVFRPHGRSSFNA